MLNIVLFGAPGAGKGTQATLLADKYGLIHLSTGVILRNEIATGSDLGKQIKLFIDKGEFVPDKLVIDIISLQIEQNPGAAGFIFDGFPRTILQAKYLDKLLKEKEMQISSMIALDVETDELVKRLMKRGEISGRADDQSLDIILNRISIYHQKTEPIIDYYHNCNKYNPIDGFGNIDEIFDRLCQHVDNL